jgi:hypothetical protein
MLNVFSDNQKPSDQIRMLQQCAGGVYTRLLFAGPEDEPLYILKPKVIDLLLWVNRKILFELPRIKTPTNVQWIGVRIRIATNMLNKLVTEGILAKEVSIEYHRRLVSNVRQILGEIYTEDLPF